VTGSFLESSPCFSHRDLTINTRGTYQFHDITDDVATFVSDYSIAAGIVVVMSMHTTAGLVVNELETGFKRDFAALADRIAPRDERYCHDDLSTRFENLCPEDAKYPNGHAHLQHTIFGSPSIVLPIEDSTLVVGMWQRVFLLEFDRPRVRRVRMQACGTLVSSERSEKHNGVSHVMGARTVRAVLR
jgi:secondary thiamine-phosphate synthase enzyme